MDINLYSKNILKGEKIYLRATDSKDIETLCKWWNDPSIKIGNRSFLIDTPENNLVEQFNIWSKNVSTDGFALSIVNNDNQLVGHISTWGVKPPLLCATVGIFVGPEFQKCGYGKEALKIVMKLLFDELNAHKIEIKVYCYNENAIKLYKSLGFIVEGTIRHASYHGGKYYDNYVMGMLEEEYRKLYSDNV